MPKISSTDRVNIDKRAADRTFWLAVLGAVLTAPVTFWFFRAVGMLDRIPPEADLYLMVGGLVVTLAFMFTHRNADGTIRVTRSVTRATSTPKPPQGRMTLLLIVATGALHWLLVNALHLSRDMRSLAGIVSSATITVLCVRYVLRAQKLRGGAD